MPDSLPVVFSVDDAREAGVDPQRLRRADLYAPFPGLRTRTAEPAAIDLATASRHYAPRLKPWQFFSHETALALLDTPLPPWPHVPGIHVSAHRPAREPRLSGARVRGHRLQLREPATIRTADGLPIEHPVRAWRQCARLWRLDDLIVAADFIVAGSAPFASVGDLRDEIETMGDTGSGILRRALREVRVGVRSPRETRLRLLLTRAGLPEPALSWNLRGADGRFVAELDLAYPQWRVATEYDGRVHADDPVQFAKDGDRWDRIRAEGWQHVRIMNTHMRGDGAPAVQKVRSALEGAGWRPGRA